jgi:hypothetical protein
MQNPVISALCRNWNDHQLRVHATRARRFIDRLTQGTSDTGVRLMPGVKSAQHGRVDRLDRLIRPGAKLNERPQARTRAILSNVYTDTR